MQSVMLVDASEELRALASAIEDEGFAVAYSDLNRTLEGARAQAPAAIVFNLLARPDGPAIKNLLRSPDMPAGVASLAVVRSDQLANFDFAIGFDDFVIHPALTEEILARVKRAIYLRSGVEGDNVLRAGELQIDLANYKVSISSKPVDLTYKEYELLRFLATNRDKVFTREALLNRVWGYDFYGGARTVDVHIRRLRSKIEDGRHTFIETVRNVGYRFHIE
jgi:two-component system, OmpR family, alkaline phosphatase synthesis response regulator PhoP